MPGIVRTLISTRHRSGTMLVAVPPLIIVTLRATNGVSGKNSLVVVGSARNSRRRSASALTARAAGSMALIPRSGYPVWALLPRQVSRIFSCPLCMRTTRSDVGSPTMALFGRGKGEVHVSARCRAPSRPSSSSHVRIKTSGRVRFPSDARLAILIAKASNPFISHAPRPM